MSVKITGNLTRDSVEEIAAMDGSRRSPNMVPRDASTLIILDRKGDEPRLLMGRRHEGHKFMPGLFVFPGGRVDRFDGSVPAAGELHPMVRDKIVTTLRRRPSERRARALALAAIRETYEEAGLLLGRRDEDGFEARHDDWRAFSRHGVRPDLSGFRLIARAITPPGRSRRFDAWFFAVDADAIAHRLDAGPSGELQELHWLTLDETAALELPVITATVIAELRERLHRDPQMKPTTDIPFFHLRGKTFLRDTI